MKPNIIPKTLLALATTLALAAAPLLQAQPKTDSKTQKPVASTADTPKKPRGTNDGRISGKPGETYEQREARLGWWREARYGMFIHWGLYSQAAGSWKGKRVPDGGAEWIQSRAKIPTAEYATLAKDFNPVDFNPQEIVRLAKAAGMKYIVITAKHHDGFAMYDSKASDYNIVAATPYKRDPIKELADACAAAGIRFGLYYSQNLDWAHPNARGNEWDFKREGDDFPKYMREKALPQVKELLTNYGPLCVFWWDFPLFTTQEESDTFYSLAWSLQPDTIMNDRASPNSGRGGDYSTPEQTIPGDTAKNDFEACMTLNETWGYRTYDDNWKSPAVVIRNLTNTASKGGNFLLNIGPTGSGAIPQPTLDSLVESGRWLKINGEAIYGTNPTPIGVMPWGRVTTKPGKMYLHVIDWPADGRVELPLSNKVKSARLLAEPDIKLKIEQATKNKNYVTIVAPAQMPDPIVTVIALDIAEPLEVGAYRGQRIMNGSFELEHNENWAGGEKDLHVVTGAEALEGKQSLQMDYKTQWEKKNFKIAHQTIRLNPGDKVMLTGMVKTDNCDEIHALLEVEFSNAKGKVLASHKTEKIAGTTAAKTYELKNLTAPEGTETAVIKCTLAKPGEKGVTHPQSATFDSVKLIIE